MAPIFRSLDKSNHGDLKPELIVQAFEKMGITIKASELNLLRLHLDVKSCGYLKYEPLVRELQGIKTEDFIIAPMRKLARLIESRDFNRVSFRAIVDPRHEENLSPDAFTRVMMQLNAADFTITTDECEQIFRQVTGAIRTLTGVQL